jgi:MFS family permease
LAQCESLYAHLIEISLTSRHCSVGGAFAENKATTWRWAFYINLCIGAAFAPIYFYYLPLADPQKGLDNIRRLKQLDFLGIVLNIGSFTALIMAINFGGNLYAWNSGQEIALWVVGGVLLLLFALQQKFAIMTTKSQRIFPADFLRMPVMWLLFALMNASATCVFVSTF